jgi:hypothetical protein
MIIGEICAELLRQINGTPETAAAIIYIHYHSVGWGMGSDY